MCRHQVAASVGELKRRLHTFYTIYKPDKLSSVDEIATRYFSRQDALDSKLKSLYGANTRSAVCVVATPSTDEQHIHKLLAAFGGAEAETPSTSSITDGARRHDDAMSEARPNTVEDYAPKTLDDDDDGGSDGDGDGRNESGDGDLLSPLPSSSPTQVPLSSSAIEKGRAHVGTPDELQPELCLSEIDRDYYTKLLPVE